MNDEKLNYVIDMIKDMDLENKLRLAICMCDNYSHTNLQYDNKEMYHLGASIKDLGKKCFGINKIEDMEIIEKIINLRYT